MKFILNRVRLWALTERNTAFLEILVSRVAKIAPHIFPVTVDATLFYDRNIDLPKVGNEDAELNLCYFEWENEPDEVQKADNGATLIYLTRSENFTFIFTGTERTRVLGRDKCEINDIRVFDGTVDTYGVNARILMYKGRPFIIKNYDNEK